MEELIVLGLVPGTSIQLQFGAVAWLLAGFVAFRVGLYAKRRHLVLIVLTLGLLTLHIRRVRA